MIPQIPVSPPIVLSPNAHHLSFHNTYSYLFNDYQCHECKIITVLLPSYILNS